MIKILCAALSAALVLAACSPGAVPREAPAEEDLPLAEELERSIWEEEEALFDNLDSESENTLLDLSEALTPMAAKSLSIPAVFGITRPTKKLTTSYASYFITGTSDSSSPVYFGDTAIERQGTKGTFGVYVELAMGTNTFTFSQNGETERVTIVRTAPAGTKAISEIRQDSMSPAYMSGVKVGEPLGVGCIAPSGATVKATYDGKTVTLKQTNTEVKKGLPATFTGKITVDGGGYDPDITQKGSKVAYSMSYNGATKNYTSTGIVYVAGENSDVAVEITSYLGFVYPDVKNLAVFKETVKAGARDYVAGETNQYFELASGGHIPKEQVKVVTGTVRVQNKLGEADFSRGSKSERFIFKGSRSPAYDTWISDNTLYLRLYNTSGAPAVSAADSRLASSCSASEADGAVTYKLPLKGLVWGFDVAFDGGDTTLLLKYKPTLSGGSAPLEGVTILLDPGHGGSDPGALGLAGTTGPTEADVNLANARATRDLLAEMGAKVIMSREGDKRVSLDERLQMIEENKADFFVSMHHNSLAESTDANKVSGMEVYYHTPQSKKFANTMMTDLAEGLGRNNRSVSQSYYRVTLLYYAPALLLELGFMSNPLEYEKAATASEMEKVAQAVADGIVSILQ